MDYKVGIIIVLTLLAAAPLATASSYDAVFNQVNNKVLAEYNIKLNSTEEIILKIPNDARAISSNANYSFEGDKLSIHAKDIRLSYISEDLLDSFGGGYYFVHEIKFNRDFDEASIRIALQEGNFVNKDKIFPKNYEIGTDGRQIFVNWQLKNVKAGESMPVFVMIEKGGEDNWTIVWISVMAAAAAGAIYYLYKKQIKKTGETTEKTKKTNAKRAESRAGEIERYLMESEKKVIDELKNADRGEMWQKQIQAATGFSKAKLSRLVRNLEARHLVEKIPFGNTNKIRIK
jgi:DNA-binding MarR family transcriptional regulator